MAKRLQDFQSNIILHSKTRGTGFQKFTRTIKTAGAAAGKFLLIAAPIIAGTLFVKAIRESGRFSKAISELSAITGSTGADLELLSTKSLEFGATTTFTAIQAAEAYKLIASAKPDLLTNLDALTETTRQTLLLAEASGIELSEAARITGQALNQFGAGAEQAARFVNVLAAGAKRGSSEVADTGVALVKVGVVAKQAGLSFEETNAALQTLAKGGLLGEEAGTALRGVLLRLAKQTHDEFNPEVVGLATAFENLGKANLSTANKVNLFGQRAIVAGNILIGGTEIIRDYTDSLSGTNVAIEQAAIRVDNLEGDITKLSSAWQGLTIQLGQGGEALGRQTVQGTTDLTAALARQLDAVKDAEDGWSLLEDTMDAFSILTISSVSSGQQFTTAWGGFFDAIGEGWATANEVNQGFHRGFIDRMRETFVQLSLISTTASDSQAQILGANRAIVSTAEERIATELAANRAAQEGLATEADAAEQTAVVVEELSYNQQRALEKLVAQTEKSLLTRAELLRQSYGQKAVDLQIAIDHEIVTEERGAELLFGIRQQLFNKLAELETAGTGARVVRLTQFVERVRLLGLTETEYLREKYDKEQADLLASWQLGLVGWEDYYASRLILQTEFNIAGDELDRAADEKRTGGLVLFLERLTEKQMTERELLQTQYDYNLEMLTLSLEAELLTEMEFNEKKALLAEELAAKRAAILNKEARAISKSDKFAKLSATAKTKFALSEAGRMLQGIGGNSKKLFKLQKALALAEAVISLPAHVSKTMAAYPYPWSIAMGALAAVASLAQIQQIKASSFGGGGGGVGGVAGGAVPAPIVPILGATPANDIPALETAQVASGANVTINIEGLPAGSLISTEAVRELIESINDELGDGVMLDVGGTG